MTEQATRTIKRLLIDSRQEAINGVTRNLYNKNEVEANYWRERLNLIKKAEKEFEEEAKYNSVRCYLYHFGRNGNLENSACFCAFSRKDADDIMNHMISKGEKFIFINDFIPHQAVFHKVSVYSFIANIANIEKI